MFHPMTVSTPNHAAPSISNRARAALLTAAVLVCACDSGEAAKPAAEAPAPPPAAASNGAPVVFEVTKFTAGAKFDGKIAVKGYNFSDKTIAGYSLAARFTDAKGTALKVGVGSPFEDTVAWTSMSGKKFACNPKSWCTLEVEGIEVPADTAKAEVALTSAKALAADGLNFEEPDVWTSKDGMGKWPSDLK